MLKKSKLYFNINNFFLYLIDIILNYSVAVVLTSFDESFVGYSINIAFSYITLRKSYKTNDQSMIRTFPDRKVCNRAFYMQHTFKQTACKVTLFYGSSSTCLYKYDITRRRASKHL